jgi:hypothetical protein
MSATSGFDFALGETANIMRDRMLIGRESSGA